MRTRMSAVVVALLVLAVIIGAQSGRGQLAGTVKDASGAPLPGVTITLSGTLSGTLPYMSPEHLDAFNPTGSTKPEDVNERSDIYALGLILFEMLAGDHPYPEPKNRPLMETIRVLGSTRTPFGV